jgi:hypothetical protein
VGPEATPGRAMLLTGRYGAIDPTAGVTIQTSLGRPRWVGYGLRRWEAVMPWGLLGEHDPERFARAYRRRLYQRTRRVLGELAELQAAYDGWPLILACFEDLRDGTRWCHRRVLAGWISTHLGIAIPDVEDPTPDP